MAQTAFGARLFDLGVELARRQASAVLMPCPADPTDRAVLTVIDVAQVFSAEISRAHSRAKLAQLRLRIAACQEALETAEQEAIAKEYQS